MTPLTDDEAALLYHVQTFGSDGYPIARLGRGWMWRQWRSVGGSPVVYKSKRAAVQAFEVWVELALARWRQMKACTPATIITAVGVITPERS